ncbi:MAG: DUF5615 family PIN-like protein [Acidobacteria bacterium]|nr:DUF5615 family PIN-like protein [Acidobacteriota bacterium]
MKLLLDQNISWRLCGRLADIYPGSEHVRNIGLIDGNDADIWDYAKENGHVVVSKDIDFQQRCLLFGHPPKVIWLRVGNCPVKTIEELLRRFSIAIHMFNNDPARSYLMVP